MKASEVEQLLRLIEAYDRTTFTAEAVDVWAEVLRDIAYEDAADAVHQIFRMHGRDEKGNIRRLLPAEVRGPAKAIGEHRRRVAAQKALRSAHRAPAERSEAASAALAAFRRKNAEDIARYRAPVPA